MKFFKAAVLALVLSLGFTSTALAVNVNPDGLGQVLFYPYYTVNNDNVTLISVVNSTDRAKAVKVRFMEGKNSREVLDFNLYLSAHDVWVASVFNNRGTPTLRITDSSCTSPYIYKNPGHLQEFLPWAIGDLDLDRAREGHIEIIEMGTVVGDSADDITHDIWGVPEDCEAIQKAWTDSSDFDEKGYWIIDPSIDMLPPSGGLFGGASVLNVEKATLFSYDAKAINGFADTLDANDFLHQVPGTVLPSLNSGNIKTGTVFLSDGDTYSATFARGVDAISFVLMHDQIMNQYSVDGGINADTEWVFTFPTKSFYVDELVTHLPVGAEPEAIPPFTAVWNGKTACETVLIDSVWDREEQTYEYVGGDLPPIVSPAPPHLDDVDALPFDLCYETNVVQFTENTRRPSQILGSTSVVYVDPGLLDFEDGWMRVQLVNYGHDANDDGVFTPEERALSREPLEGLAGLRGLKGLPVVGIAFTRYVNGFVGEDNDTVANFGGTWDHKGTRKRIRID
jgi:hypothetical protein